jgi:hypothetical protein
MFHFAREEMDAETLQELRGWMVAILTLVNMTSPGGPSVPAIIPIIVAEGAVQEAPAAEQVMEEAGRMAEEEEIAEQEGQAEQEMPQHAREEEGEAVPEVPQQAMEELGPAGPEVQQEAGQDLPQAEDEMQQPALEEAEEDVPEMEQHAVEEEEEEAEEEEDLDVVVALLERIGHVVDEADLIDPSPVQSVPKADQVVLLDGQKLVVTGHVLIPDSQVTQDDAELMVGQQDKITVSAVYETDSGLVVQMLGVVKVRLGSVTVSADDLALDEEIVLPSEALILMQPGQTILMSGTLVVQQGGVITVGGIDMVKVGGLLKVTPGRTPRVRADVLPVSGTVRINAAQVVLVAGRMCAHASQKAVGELLLVDNKNP